MRFIFLCLIFTSLWILSVSSYGFTSQLRFSGVKSKLKNLRRRNQFLLDTVIVANDNEISSKKIIQQGTLTEIQPPRAWNPFYLFLVGGITSAAVVVYSESFISLLKGLSSKSFSPQSFADNGFVQSFLLVFLSELGDKTFFLAALSAAKYGRFITLTSSIAALASMTIISTIIGQLFHAIPPSLSQGIPFDLYIATMAFSFFGLKTIYDASQLSLGESTGMEEEKAEAEELIEQTTKQQDQQQTKHRIRTLFFQIFALVFAAEVGDRSFLSTIALSASLNPWAVCCGATAAHSLATAIAVVAGVFLSKYFSEKVIGYIGGSLFLLFAGTTARKLFSRS
jgi:putative Ca2+/H+ antiporter (TMEM165/GDT1 family)